eukprot:2473735-Amphidinium_carterae.1
MRPTWNNVTQQPNEFIKTFQNWRDEIYNYEQSVTELPKEMKMTLIIRLDDTKHTRRHQITHADELQAIYSRL